MCIERWRLSVHSTGMHSGERERERDSKAHAYLYSTELSGDYSALVRKYAWMHTLSLVSTYACCGMLCMQTYV